MLASLDVGALIRGTIGPRLETFSVLLVLFPLAAVLRSVQVTVGALPVRFIVLPVAIVDVTVGVDQSSLTIGLVVSPVALVHGTVGPDLDTSTLANVTASAPLAFIACTILQRDHVSRLPLTQLLLELEVVIVELTELLTHILSEQKDSC